MTFPSEAVPDGALFAPHHSLLGWYAALLLLAVLWDNLRHGEPVVVAALIGVAMFGWFHVWRYYPVLGALLVLGGTAGALVWLVAAHHVVPEAWTVWDEYPRLYGYLVGLALLVALDDAVSHALGWWSPLDWFFKAYMLPWLA